MIGLCLRRKLRQQPSQTRHAPSGSKSGAGKQRWSRKTRRPEARRTKKQRHGRPFIGQGPAVGKAAQRKEADQKDHWEDKAHEE